MLYFDTKTCLLAQSKAVSRFACHRTPNWRCDMTTIRQLIGVVLFVPAVFIYVSAQAPQRKPSEATRPVVVMPAQSLNDLKEKLKPGNKTEELIDSASMELRVAVSHENNKTDEIGRASCRERV